MYEALTPAIILLGAGLLALAAAKQLKTSPILGFLIAGVIVGPFGLGLIGDLDGDTIDLLAKLGVVFLLFEIGMHFTLRTLRENRSDMLSLAPLQYVITTVAFTVAAVWLFQLDLAVAIAVGGALAISSTAVVARVLVDRNQGACPVGRSAINVLVFQDIFAVFLLIYGASLLSAGAGDGAALATDLALAAGKTLLGFGLALSVGPLILRPVFGFLARARNQEAFTAISLFLALTLAAGAALAGLSETLGGFLAGMMIGATQYRHVIETEAKPFRNLLLSFFFISVGMSIDLNAVAANLAGVVGLAIAMVAVKLACTWLAARLSGWTTPGALQLSALLAQGSEFAFIILALPAITGAIPAQAASSLIAAVALTLAMTPFVAQAGAKLARTLAKRRAGDVVAAAAQEARDASAPQGGPIILYGMGEIGRRAADALRAHHVAFVAIETDPDRFEAATADCYDVVFGDPGDLRMMETIGATQARAIALSQPRYEISRDLTEMVRQQYPNLARFVAVADETDAARHAALGMVAVREEAMPSGLGFAARLLAFAGVGQDRIEAWRRAEQRRAQADPDSSDILDDGAEEADPAAPPRPPQPAEPVS